MSIYTVKSGLVPCTRNGRGEPHLEHSPKGDVSRDVPTHVPKTLGAGYGPRETCFPEKMKVPGKMSSDSRSLKKPNSLHVHTSACMYTKTCEHT